MYVLLGSNGNITAKAAHLLLSQGKKIRVVGRNAQSLATLKTAGADIALGDVADVDFLAGALRGADVAYVMIPPNYTSPDMRADQARVGEAIAKAIAASGVKRIVNLSSTGADLASGTGPITGLHDQEQRLNRLADVDVLHLRPGYFFENHLNAIGLINGLGVYADMMAPDAPIPSIATADIAAVVARELVNFKTRGKAVLHLRAAKFYTQAEATAILGNAIGKPGLPYVKADPAQAKAGMVQHGLSSNVADLFEEMSFAFSTGLVDPAVAAGSTEATPTTLEQFAATVFKSAFSGQRKAA